MIIVNPEILFDDISQVYIVVGVPTQFVNYI